MERYNTEQNRFEYMSKSRFKEIIDKVQKKSFIQNMKHIKKKKKNHTNSQIIDKNKIIPKEVRQSINQYNYKLNSRTSVMIQLNKVKRNQELFVEHKPNQKDLLQLPQIVCRQKNAQDLQEKMKLNKKWKKNLRNQEKFLQKLPTQNKENSQSNAILKLQNNSLQKINKSTHKYSLQKLSIVGKERLSQCPSFYFKQKDQNKNKFNLILHTDQNRNSKLKKIYKNIIKV